jgi:peptidoglycan/LPS O-acetylase OafA/YrhL
MLNNFYNKFRRITSGSVYQPEVDGLRFLAISMILLLHIHLTLISRSTIPFEGDPHTYKWLKTILLNGHWGVPLFFVLSGFILCLPFARHYISGTPPVSLKAYYLRRLTRLEPPYFIAMFVLCFIQLLMHTNPPSVLLKSWLASMAYINNFVYNRGALFDQVTWTLEIEIQFYLLAPLLFSIFRWRPLGRRTALVLLTVLFVAAQVWYLPAYKSIYHFIQYFLLGMLIAELYVSNVAAEFFGNKWVSLLAPVCLAAIFFFPPTAGETFRIQVALKLYFLLMIGVLFYVVLKNRMVGNVFGMRFISLIGGMCYSIYLLHYPILNILQKYTFRVHFTSYYLPNLALQLLLLGVPIVVISGAFYYFVERPFMSRKWMDRILGSSRVDAATELTSRERNDETRAS